jgi:hypothetical protein
VNCIQEVSSSTIGWHTNKLTIRREPRHSYRVDGLIHTVIIKRSHSKMSTLKTDTSKPEMFMNFLSTSRQIPGRVP